MPVLYIAARPRASGFRLAYIVNHLPHRRPGGIFGRCKACNGLTIKGICQACGFAVVCSGCGRLRYPDSTWHHVPRLPGPESHGMCPACIRRQYGEAIANSVEELRRWRESVDESNAGRGIRENKEGRTDADARR